MVCRTFDYNRVVKNAAISPMADHLPRWFFVGLPFLST